MKNFFLVLTIISSLLFVACGDENSTDVNQDRIYTAYWVEYDAGTNKTTAYARFTFGDAFGTALELDGTSEVKFNGDVLGYVSSLTYYRKEYTGFVNGGTYVFTDANGKVMTNAAPTVDSIRFVTVPVDTIRKATTKTLAIGGPAIGAGQKVSLEMLQSSPYQLNYFLSVSAGATSVPLDSLTLDKYTVGPANLKYSRSKDGVLSQATSAGGTIETKFKTSSTAGYVK